MVSDQMKVRETPSNVCAGFFREEKLLALPWSLTMTDRQPVSCTALGKPLICQC